MSAPERPRLVVTAAVIERDGAYLITRRPHGAHLAGLWEFPGGKVDAGESLQESLAREIREELACDADIGREVFSISHTYPERTVELHFFACTLKGEPSPALGQELRWVPRGGLRSLDFPPPDHGLIELLADQGRATR